MKDYYSILELAPSASLDEVKKAYRRLAHQYHPDKNGNDLYAATQFAEIKEAYETLSHPLKKDYYLQQRWYAKSTGQKTTQQIITPVTILKQLLELDKYISRLDVHRMDKEGLFEYLFDIFSTETVDKLNAFNEPEINKGIAYAAVRGSRHLSYTHIKLLSQKILKLNVDASVVTAVQQHVLHAKQSDKWNRYKFLVVLSLVILLCAMIYIISR
ncbi:MAG: DnaJ domain-containing protein [Chitinophagaceae bacterium]